MKSAPGEGPEAQLIKNDRFYKLFGFTIAKYTAKTMLLQLFSGLKTASRRRPWTPLWGTLGGPKTQHFVSKTKTFWICDRAKNGPKLRNTHKTNGIVTIPTSNSLKHNKT